MRNGKGVVNIKISQSGETARKVPVVGPLFRPENAGFPIKKLCRCLAAWRVFLLKKQSAL